MTWSPATGPIAVAYYRYWSSTLLIDHHVPLLRLHTCACVPKKSITASLDVSPDDVKIMERLFGLPTEDMIHELPRKLRFEAKQQSTVKMLNSIFSQFGQVVKVEMDKQDA